MSENGKNQTDVNQTCFICFEDIAPKIQRDSANGSNGSNEEQNILKMSDCGCNEYVHQKCIGEWIEREYEDYIPDSEIRCPICNTYCKIQSPEPLFTRNISAIRIQRFFSRFQRNQTQHFNHLLLVNPFHPRHPIHEQPLLNGQQQQVDVKRFLIVSCGMVSIGFILIWMLFIFNISPN